MEQEADHSETEVETGISTARQEFRKIRELVNCSSWVGIRA